MIETGGVMLSDKDVRATIAVSDLDAAKKFYGSTLGLTAVDTGDREVLAYKTGSSRLMVYRSQYAGTNKATAATWTVGKEVDAIAKALKAKGVAFEKYDMPDMTHEGDVHVSGPMRVAWFKDPEGNILSIVNAPDGG